VGPTSAGAAANGVDLAPVVALAAVGGQTRNVSVVSSAFESQFINVTAGDTVRWNFEAGGHTVTSEQPGLFDSGSLNFGDTFEYTFTTPGRFAYYCVFHGVPGFGMYGEVNVAAPAPEPGVALICVPLIGLAVRRSRRDAKACR
jgi:plastocyanin